MLLPPRPHVQPTEPEIPALPRMRVETVDILGPDGKPTGEGVLALFRSRLKAASCR